MALDDDVGECLGPDWEPTANSLTSIDSFLLLENLTVTIQITVAQTHPTKAARINKILNMLGSKRSEKVVLFIVSEDSALGTKQNYSPKDGTEEWRERIPQRLLRLKDDVLFGNTE